MYKTVPLNYCRKVFCVTAYPCVSTSVPLTYVWAFGFVGCILFYFLLFLSHRLLLLLFSLFPSFTRSYSFSNQTIVAEWLFVMQSSAGRRVVCSARGGLSRVCYNGTLYPSNEGNPLVFWWIAVTLLWPGRGDFSASGLSTFKKIALTSALDCTSLYINVKSIFGCSYPIVLYDRQ